MTDPTPSPAPDEQLSPWRLALYALAVSILGLLRSLDVVHPDLVPHILEVVGDLLAIASLAVAAWTNPSGRRLRARGRHGA